MGRRDQRAVADRERRRERSGQRHRAIARGPEYRHRADRDGNHRRARVHGDAGGGGVPPDDSTHGLERRG